ncbi:MAG: MFS transporter [Dehalococcoidia bacterium]|nr:MFS transporter [Dehalococcoidia bacterium]
MKKSWLPHIYAGWWTVLGGGILALWGHGYHAYGISALFKPIAQELNLNRAETSIPSSIGRLEGGIEAPLTGWITDRFGARWIIISGVFLISLSLILMYFVNSKWAFYAVWGVMLGTGTNIALTLPIDATISNWFVKKRGLALSIKWVFSGLSGVLVLPLIAWLIQVRDWREACLVGGIVMAVVGLPLAWFAIKPRRPEFYGLLPDGARLDEAEKNDREKVIEKGIRYASELQEVEFTLRQALKTRAYWLMLVVQMIPGLVAPVMSIHTINFLTDMGIDPMRAAAIMAMMIFFSLPTRFLSGIISDRLRNDQLRYVKMVSYFLQGIGVVIFLLYPSMVVVYIWFILYGLGQGFGNTLNPLIRARFFGRKAFGSIHGITQMLSTPIGVIAPTYAGWIYDTTGSYTKAFIQFAVLLGVAVVLAFFLLPPKPPERIEDVRKFV